MYKIASWLDDGSSFCPFNVIDSGLSGIRAPTVQAHVFLCSFCLRRNHWHTMSYKCNVPLHYYSDSSCEIIVAIIATNSFLLSIYLSSVPRVYINVLQWTDQDVHAHTITIICYRAECTIPSTYLNHTANYLTDSSRMSLHHTYSQYNTS